MNIQTSTPPKAISTPSGATSAPSTEPEQAPSDKLEISVSVPQVTIDTAQLSRVAYKAVRALPGAVNLAWNAPVVTVAPILNAIDPATDNRDAIFYERWSNVLGTAAIGSAVGAIIGGASGHSWAGAGLGLLGGAATGGVRSLVSQLWTPKVGGYYGTEAAKYPEIGESAQRASYGSQSKSYAVGARLREGYATAFSSAYEGGGEALDSLTNNSTAFLRGIVGKPE